ncbi:GAF and ANTAR domain-containing protein [Rhodococcus sp. IEGM 1304]|uniref:GAF and ANTAR domain-containing protein n=1 Tax=Rhodococcus sp. IEGM 1304 TaxID=3082227 RepID=UPI0029540EE6|nr:GAF and ANTAR domain-containing protein [Rhodococcus sp. IEGM 1304]MDV8129112.1 GAF and ANTAR domain-containing protein [Rhodococcus sp. IEGM 1304]
MSTDLSPRESQPSEPFEMTKQLARELVRETGIDGVGVAVFATESTRDLVYATDGVAEELDETQFTLGEGPCLDAFRFDTPELHPDMAGGEARARWPLFTAQVLALGAASVYAYPLGGGGSPFGVLELYGSSPIALAPSEDVKCRSYAHTIAHAVLAELAPAYALTSGSDVGVFRRGNVNIACGILAAHHRVSVEEAMVRLRSRAFSRQHRITSIAQEVIAGDRFDTDD